MASIVERLIILNDVATGLHARLHRMIKAGSSTHQKFNADAVKFGKSLEKKFPDYTELQLRGGGADSFQRSASDIMNGLASYYSTFLDMINFTDEAWKLITEAALNFSYMKWELNTDVMHKYFTV
jgi:hypothetical protein